MTRERILPALLLFAAAACAREPNDGAAAIQKAYIGPELAADSAPSTEESSRRACEKHLREVLAEPAMPGAPSIDSGRAFLLARVKSEPALFVDVPRYESGEASLTVKGFRQMLLLGENPYGVVSKLLEEAEGNPKLARDVLLRDGYLYAEDPDVGYAMVSLVQPDQLFGHERIWIQRGESVVHAERRAGRYYYTDGPLVGQRVRLVLFDRAGGGDGPGPAVHRDLRALRQELHFDRMQIRHVTADHIVANLRYGKWWVPSVLETDGPHVKLECESLSPHLVTELATWREAGHRRQLAVQALRRAMLSELDEALPFDEPLHEYGFQLDGTLRRKWLTAYTAHRDRYAVNGDPYQVFDPKGRPLTPEVCVDFLTDTLERTAGTSFRPRGQKPGRAVGKLDFDAVSPSREELRRVPGFVQFAREHPDWFDVMDGDEHIVIGNRERFFGYLADHADDFAVGDAVLIKGKTPWDAVHVHFHSFFVYESDPVTGMPLVVVGNAGRPSLRSWEAEVRRTPKRSILQRIRFKTEWLESIAGVEPLDAIPPLAAGPE